MKVPAILMILCGILLIARSVLLLVALITNKPFSLAAETANVILGYHNAKLRFTRRGTRELVDWDSKKAKYGKYK